MQKNVASQKLIVFAFDSTTNLPKTGDAANITAYVSKDYGAVTVLGDTSATEMEATNAKGYYLFDLTQAETNADTLMFSAKSATGNIVVIGVPATVFTTPPNFSLESIDASGRLDVIKIAGTTQTARDIGASVLLSSGTGTGQLDFTSGVVKANLVQILATALTETAGQIAAAFKKLFDVAAPVLTATSVNQTGDNFARLGAPAGASVSADVAAVKAVLPSALVGGRIDASIGAVAANAITAAGIADGAIDRATLAADTGLQSIRSNTAQAGAAGTITLDASASATTDFYVGLWCYITGATGVGQVRLITAYNGTTKVATIAPNWATNPDNTSTFALITAGQITGVQGNVTGSVASVTGAVGSVTGNVGGSVASVTGNVGGNVTGSVGTVNALAANTITAASMAADASNEIADQVWDEAIAGHLGAGSTGAALNAAGSAGDPWTTPLPGAYGAGTAGKIVGDNINATISSRAPESGGNIAAIKAKTDQLVFTLANKVDASIQAAGDLAQAAVDKVWLSAARTLTAFGFSVTVGTNNDKTGYQLSATGVDDVWNEALAGHLTAGSTGAALNSASSGGSSPAAIADAVWDELIAGHLGAGSTGESLSNAGGGSSPAAIADAVWDEAIADHLNAGSTGLKLNSVTGAFPAGAVEFTYTVTDTNTTLPIEGVEVWFATDVNFANIVWKGDTDAFGIAMDVNGNKPQLDAGTYYIRSQKSGYVFPVDTEVVS